MIRIGITGSPGTGKKSVGKELARITGLEFVSISDLAIQKKYGKWVNGEFLVDINKVRGKVDTKGKIVCGHLLPYVVPKSDLDFVAILRCSPAVLKKRYALRRYSKKKIQENIEAEMLDVISAKSLEVYGKGKVAEFDTSRTKSSKTIAIRIVGTIEGKRSRRFGIVNWSARAGRSVEELLRTLQVAQ